MKKVREVGGKTLNGRLIVFREKHGDRIFRVETDEKLWAVALKVLKERDAEDYWYEEPEVPEKPTSLLLTNEQIATLSEGARDVVKQDQEQYERNLREHRTNMARYQRLRQAIDLGDGRLALRVLGERKDYEYEGWDFEYLDEV